MKLMYSIKRAVVVVGILAILSITAVAQENRSEISLQGTGFFTKDADGNGIRQHATDTGGFLVGYRYNFNRWLAPRGWNSGAKKSKAIFGAAKETIPYTARPDGPSTR